MDATRCWIVPDMVCCLARRGFESLELPKTRYTIKPTNGSRKISMSQAVASPGLRLRGTTNSATTKSTQASIYAMVLIKPQFQLSGLIVSQFQLMALLLFGRRDSSGSSCAAGSFLLAAWGPGRVEM